MLNFGRFLDRNRALSAAATRSQAVIEFALDGTILDANENFLRTMGYTIAEIRGRNHAIFLDPADVQSPVYRAFWDDLRQGEYTRARGRSPDGRRNTADHQFM